MRSVLLNRYLLAVLLPLLNSAKAFTIDTTIPIIKTGPPGSYFGFSVAHKRWEYPEEDYRERIIVGAPKFSDPEISDGNEQGAVFDCGGVLNNNCRKMSYAKPRDIPSNYVENRTGMWFGVTVAGDPDKEGPIMACGHRAVLANTQTGSLSIVGRCMRYLHNSDVDSFSPCLEESYDNEDSFYGWCQAGSSLAVQDSTMFMGAPGGKTWTGAFKWQDDTSVNLLVQGTQKYSYLGSSVAAAKNLLGDGLLIAASGAPKADDVGEVLLFAYKSTASGDSGDLRLTLSGDQFGSSFGHSIATIDVAANKTPSLVVSAPYYRGRNIGGAIYIYDNYGQGILRSPRKVLSRSMTDRDCADLRCEDAAFGYSLASIGDINGDGYNDLVVGAPYEGAGAVYIFLARKDNSNGNIRLSETFSQRIYASELPQLPLGFGVSVAGYKYPTNIEGYDYLVVGAYKSDKVYLLRTRPVVTISAYVMASSEVDPSPPGGHCPYRSDVSMPCGEIRICFRPSTDRSMSGATIVYKLIGDAGESPVARRRIQMDPLSDTTELTNQTDILMGHQKCVTHLAFVRDVRDLLKPMIMVVEFDVKAVKPTGSTTSLISYPVLDITSSRSEKYDLQFRRQCVSMLCDTHVTLALSFPDSFVTPDDNASSNTFVFSSGEIDILTLAITVTVPNEWDLSPAYEPVVTLDVPQQLSYSAYESSVLQPISCSSNATRVTCVLPKIMLKGAAVTFSVKLKVVTLGSVPSTIFAFVNLSNPDKAMADNVRNISIRQVIKTDMAVVGQAAGGQVFYNDSVRGSKSILYLDEIGSHVLHRYTIINNGPGDVAQVTLTAEWPYETTKSGYLLYMEREPELRREDDNSLLPCKFDGSKINPEGYVARPSSSQGSAGVPTTVAPSRGRRSVPGSGESTVGGGSSALQRQQVTLDCRQKTAKCFNITCDIPFFQKKTGYVLSLSARLWGSTLWSEGYKHDVEVVHIISRASLYIDPALNIEQPTQNDVAFISTDAQPSIVPPSKEYVAWWIYAVAGGGGLLLLVAIILIFWKCGFFQRHRPMLHEGKVEKKRSDVDCKYEAVPSSEKSQ